MLKTNHFLGLILLLAFFPSCTTMALKSAGILEPENKMREMSNGERSVVFLGMHHIGVKEYYASTKKIVDSLQKAGYVAFLEGVQYKTQDTAIRHQADLKFRRITGISLTPKGYLDTVTNTLGQILKVNRKYALRNQPRYNKLGVDTTTAQSVDVPKNVLVEVFEQRYGGVKLEACDYKTPPDSVYKCEKLPKDLRKAFNTEVVLGYRNKNLADAIANSGHKKILVIYGKGHFDGLLKELKQKDAGWNEKQ